MFAGDISASGFDTGAMNTILFSLAIGDTAGPSAAVKVPTMGGSVPLEKIEGILGTRTITVPIANHDNSQHSFNENIRIQNLWDGIEIYASLMTMKTL